MEFGAVYGRDEPRRSERVNLGRREGVRCCAVVVSTVGTVGGSGGGSGGGAAVVRYLHPARWWPPTLVTAGVVTGSLKA